MTRNKTFLCSGLLLAVCSVFASEPAPSRAVPASQPVVSLKELTTEIQKLKSYKFKDKLSADEIYRAKRTAEVLSDDSPAEILQLWLIGEVDYVELLWWRKDDSETRAFIVSLEWCMKDAPGWRETEKLPWPEDWHRFSHMAERFEPAERALRLGETELVRGNRKYLREQLYKILSASHVKMAKDYQPERTAP
jgi:hypothetical protein